MYRTEKSIFMNMCMIYDGKGNLNSSNEGEVYWISLEELKKRKRADKMNSTLKIFLNKNFSEQFFYKSDGEWIEVLK